VSNPLRRWAPTLGGVLVLALCVVASAALLDQRLASTLTCETIQVMFRHEGLADGNLVVRTQVRNNSRIGATYRGFDAELMLNGDVQRYSVSGLKPGDRIESGELIELEVVIDMGTLEMIATGLGAVMKGRVEVVLDGEVLVAVFGVPLTVPLRINRQVKIWPGS